MRAPHRQVPDEGARAARPLRGSRRAPGHQAALAGARGDQPEERAVQRVDPGGEELQPAEAEAEDRVLAVSRVERGPAAGLQDREVRRAAHRLVERGEEDVGRALEHPGVLHPAHPDLRVRPAVDPAGRTIRVTEPAVIGQLTVVGEGKQPGLLEERLGVRHPEPREARRAPQVDEGRRRLGAADLVPAGIVPERGRGPVGVEEPPGRVQATPHAYPAMP